MADTKDLIQTALDREAGSFRRRMAVLDLAKAEDPSVVEALTQLMGDEDHYMRREVISALAKRPEEAAVDPLIKALADDDDTVQRYAADALGERVVTRAIASLEALADDNSYSVRDAAKRSIERIKRDQPATPAATTSAPSPTPAPPAAPISSATPTISKPVTPAPAPVIVPIVTTPSTPAPPLAQANVEEPPIDEVELLTEPPAPAVEEAPSAPSPEVVPAEIVFVEPSTDTQPVKVVELDENEIVMATAVPTADEPAPTAIEVVSDVPSRKLPWAQAVRMRVFFGDQLSKAENLYEAIRACRERQLKDEQKHHKALMTLGMERADKEDDLARVEEATEAAQQRMRELQQRSTARLKEKHRLKQEAASVWNQMSGSIFPDRKAEQAAQLQKLDDELGRLRGKIDEVRDELESLEQQHQRLAGPMAELQTSVERLTKTRDTAVRRLVKLERKLENLILNVIEGLANDERKSRLDRLADLSAQGDYLRVCMEQLETALHSLRAEAADAKRAEAALDQAREAARTGLETLGATMASGFHVSASEKETAVRLSGAVRFQEDHSFMGGYSGASGSARGSGSGHASYVVEEIDWRPAGDLQQQVATLTDAWSVCGEQSARLEILSGLRTVRRRHISEYVHFLRTELERDFQQESR